MQVTQKIILETLDSREQVTARELSIRFKWPQGSIQQMLYELKRKGLLEIVEKRNRGPAFNFGLENVYQKTNRDEVKVPQGYIEPFSLTGKFDIPVIHGRLGR